MCRVKAILIGYFLFAARCWLALRYMRHLNYSRRLAWAKAAR